MISVRLLESNKIYNISRSTNKTFDNGVTSTASTKTAKPKVQRWSLSKRKGMMDHPQLQNLLHRFRKETRPGYNSNSQKRSFEQRYDRPCNNSSLQLI